MEPIALTADLVAAGWRPEELRRLTAHGQLSRIRRGAYGLGAPAERSEVDEHRRLVEATLRQTSVDGVLSHSSAAALQGLPVPAGQLTRVHLTRDRPGGGKVRRWVHLHVAPLPAGHVTLLDGRACTTVARTAADLIRVLSPGDAVALGDAALRAGLSRDALDRILRDCTGWRGVARARRLATLLDERSESVGESRSRLVLHELGLPPPLLQYEVRHGARLVGRADFAWRQQWTLGEFDGRVKYGRLLRPGQTAADAVYDEKLREDALRDAGWQVVRWVWADLDHPDELRDRLLRAFARGRRAA